MVNAARSRASARCPLSPPASFTVLSSPFLSFPESFFYTRYYSGIKVCQFVLKHVSGQVPQGQISNNAGEKCLFSDSGSPLKMSYEMRIYMCVADYIQ